MKNILKMVIQWLSHLSCKSKCCSGSSCECGPKDNEKIIKEK